MFSIFINTVSMGMLQLALITYLVLYFVSLSINRERYHRLSVSLNTFHLNTSENVIVDILLQYNSGRPQRTLTRFHAVLWLTCQLANLRLKLCSSQKCLFRLTSKSKIYEQVKEFNFHSTYTCNSHVVYNNDLNAHWQ